MYEEIIILPIDICRICTNLQPSLNNILTDKLEDEHVLLHEALEFVGCIRIDFDDGMSLSMCLTCSKKLSDAYKFKNQILDSYRSFYNQTSDFKFKKEAAIHENDNLELTTTTIIESTNSSFLDANKEREEPALVIERANELGIKLSTDAVSFLIEHNNFKTKNKIEPLIIEQKISAKDDKTVVTEQMQIMEQNNFDTPSMEVETLEIKSIELEDSEYPLEIKMQNKKCYKLSPTKKENNNKTPPTRRKRRISRSELSSSADEYTFNSSNNTCHICLKTLPKKSNLQDHLRLHANEKNFVCSYCKKAFVQIANYRTHLRVHTKERPFQCHLCSKNYSQAGTLKSHIRSHTDERNHICEVCYKTFTNSSDLSKHKRIHDLSRQFKCETCGHLFTQKANLRAHERNVHYK